MTSADLPGARELELRLGGLEKQASRLEFLLKSSTLVTNADTLAASASTSNSAQDNPNAPTYTPATGLDATNKEYEAAKASWSTEKILLRTIEEKEKLINDMCRQ
ncbi:hypothetical protein BASA50_002780 [Batrachochytrium salamandrivorans]|uniref:Uncharacterized protein n=1 Tax=Batrachochytrium salamandrivorans TaxID=1357716 RepID=A0ABQ8FK86_9FUNG|nr:hypothetical protein BASA60_008486 [Batrachochytrium salamandrivorans]KAH6570643.1 hypothetical protein BASA62_004221 [Batrachochytrium salamandrivorans]KAH6580572.1 hypothetical protein BASA61_009584 [Batrachochytrium salamandrivorans]KAH6599755.1 hypothetical protein BASA50_002780 [Batrachochytrium salamandrivorans]KAH9274070.1 hypothetical protein BASA83_003712 [Batrachochytrium salamandrivorans]